MDPVNTEASGGEGAETGVTSTLSSKRPVFGGYLGILFVFEVGSRCYSKLASNSDGLHRASDSGIRDVRHWARCGVFALGTRYFWGPTEAQLEKTPRLV